MQFDFLYRLFISAYFPCRLFFSPHFITYYFFPRFSAWSPSLTGPGSFPHCMTFICSGEISLKACIHESIGFHNPIHELPCLHRRFKGGSELSSPAAVVFFKPGFAGCKFGCSFSCYFPAIIAGGIPPPFVAKIWPAASPTISVFSFAVFSGAPLTGIMPAITFMIMPFFSLVLQADDPA